MFPDEDAGLLKAWIVKRLENTSDADAEVLADYVLALLRHEGTPEEVRALCEKEIPDFLKEDSAVFLDDVFAAIEFRSYVPGAPSPPSRSAPSRPAPPLVSGGYPPNGPLSHVPPSGPGYPPVSLAATSEPNIPRYPASMSGAAPPLGSSHATSRKRSYHERGDADSLAGNDRGPGGRMFKQPRRQGGFGNGAPPGGGVIPPSGPAAMSGRLAEPNPPLLNLGAMDLSMAGFPAQPPFAPPRFPAAAAGRGQQPKRRSRCRDYDRQGFCARGNTCMFEHGPAAGYTPQMPLAPQVPMDAYDPTTAALVLPSSNGGMMPSSQLPLAPPFAMDGWPGLATGDSRQGRPFRKGRGGRSQLSAEGPVHDKSKSTIVVENIPEDNFTEEAVRAFFSQFGNIVDISMQPYKRLALVKYDKWHSANAAWKSPKVVFDNRFVRIFWYNGDNVALPASTPLKSPAGVPGANGNGISNGNGAKGEAAHGHGHGAEDASEAPAVHMDGFLRKQNEAQKAFEEKKRKKEEVERQRRELEQRQKELLARQEEEKQRLLAKMTTASPEAGGKNPDTGDESSSPEITFSKTSGGSSSAKTPAAAAHTEALRAQLAALEEEAKSMGLNPNEMADEPGSQWGAPPFRGRGGASLGGYRGRGRAGNLRSSGYPPRGFRGGLRGRGGSHAGYTAYSIDNRPKKIAVTGVDFTSPEKDEKLRQYLLGIGEFSGIQTTATVTRITFNDRRTAETFFYGLTGTGKKIPGVDGTVEVEWVSDSASTSTSGGGTQVASAASTSTTSAANSHAVAATDTSSATDGAGSREAATAAADGDVVMSSTRDDEAAANDYDEEVPDDQDWDVA